MSSCMDRFCLGVMTFSLCVNKKVENVFRIGVATDSYDTLPAQGWKQNHC